MYSWRKYILAVVAVATAAGFGNIKSSHRHIPADIRDAVADNRFDTSIPSFEKNDGKIPEPKAAAVKGINKGYVEPVEPATPIEYVAIPGGKFTMGTTSIEEGFEDAKPVPEVTIKTFQMAKTAVTVAQYSECVIKGGCTKPGTGEYCNWGKSGRQLHPVNCVEWDQAQAYAKFKGARLPSEAEFEYAATSGGRNQKYPWGNDEPTCDKAVMNGNGGYGCGTNSTMPVCSKPKGNTAQGLCDVSGNVWQWVQDKYQDSYKGAPIDGSAFEGAGSGRVIRGGSFLNVVAGYLRADNRSLNEHGSRNNHIGFRLVRSSR
ncbi:MAG: hypothetical protein A2X35_00705 [Elusimicrobia bacterium GWA2_61_42]|nr:MAG: hypothetical protein A2X35_00705 [Elusimicrobia bacterium GWA2_61_42]